ncbi:hypothetical protein B0H21DRAFT_696088 [Amylocystis lapponica]|nr:hypothetical protein B0H21DRAFT_696088 [Amylocystis lapponica]
MDTRLPISKTKPAIHRRSLSQDAGESRRHPRESGRGYRSAHHSTAPYYYSSGHHHGSHGARPKDLGSHYSLYRPATPVQSWSPQQPRQRILFYHKHNPHYGFTNFSPHPVRYKRKLYPTSEHLFQSFKFQKHRPNLAEHIRTCSQSPSVAFSEARRFQPEVRADWREVNIAKMDKTLWYKFTQHNDLKRELLATGDAELVEDSAKDAFWGIGADGSGSNELGKALERLRSRLRPRRT